MRSFQITLGDTIDNGGEDYGTFDATTPEAALLACRRDADPHREYEAPVQLSTSAGFGRGTPGVVNGNGAADRSGWWYVSDAATGALAGIYTVAEVTQDA